MVRPGLSGAIAKMILRDDEPYEMTAAEWIATYDDLEALVAPCHDEDGLWTLARAMVEGAHACGYGEVDVGDMMGILKQKKPVE